MPKTNLTLKKATSALSARILHHSIALDIPHAEFSWITRDAGLERQRCYRLRERWNDDMNDEKRKPGCMYRRELEGTMAALENSVFFFFFFSNHDTSISYESWHTQYISLLEFP
jgi:hypothetical protein